MKELLYQITSINRAWKLARDQWGEDSKTALMLRERKSSLQSSLIREYPNQVFLRLDTENTEGESLFSVRLHSEVTLPNGIRRVDAEHLPVRLAEELFTSTELDQLVHRD
ncbi:hypothetical protein [Neptuniibacter marinus]|uniref:hypothetical protein n=1 Tax=Neptuniibacter marinus TaxID=1806670 RepID=UPI003B5BBF37